MAMTMVEKIRAEQRRLSAEGVSLKNDARYWDLCRTYGDDSAEVLGYVRACGSGQPSTTDED